MALKITPKIMFFSDVIARRKYLKYKHGSHVFNSCEWTFCVTSQLARKIM